MDEEVLNNSLVNAAKLLRELLSIYPSIVGSYFFRNLGPLLVVVRCVANFYGSMTGPSSLMN